MQITSFKIHSAELHPTVGFTYDIEVDKSFSTLATDDELLEIFEELRDNSPMDVLPGKKLTQEQYDFLLG